tara:strand:- start:270 stop:557 length:288 start_codon:yes stop_codon:yes gene_type:complete
MGKEILYSLAIQTIVSAAICYGCYYELQCMTKRSKLEDEQDALLITNSNINIKTLWETKQIKLLMKKVVALEERRIVLEEKRVELTERNKNYDYP